MKKILDTINNFIINDNMIIECNKYNYIIPIKNGSIETCCIINELLIDAHTSVWRQRLDRATVCFGGKCKCIKCIIGASNCGGTG